MSHSGYVIDERLKDGDLCFQGPLVIFTGKMTRSLFTGVIDKTVEVHPWHDALPGIARWLADNPDGATELWAHLDDLGEEQETPRLRSLRDALGDALSTDGGA